LTSLWMFFACLKFAELLEVFLGHRAARAP
jgi:hypothetical protein